MSDNKVLISDLLSKFEEEDIAEPEKNKIESSSVDESDTFSTPDMDVTSESATVSNSENINYNISPGYTTTYLPLPVTYLPINNTSPYLAQPVINLIDGISSYIVKYVRLPNSQLCAYIHSYINYTSYLCTINMQTGQFQPIAIIKFENSEYVVYQNGYRCGIVYGNPYEQTWQFIPDGMAVPQTKQCNSPNVQNSNPVKYTFNNVPYEQAKDIIDTITRNNPSFPVEVNFASPKTDDFISSDIIDISSDESNIPYK